MEHCVKNLNEFLYMADMLRELPIKENQIRYYIKNGQLNAEKVRNKYRTTRKDFNDFKLALKF